MSYQDVYNLGTDPQFRNRLAATLTTESVVKTNDPLADQALRNPDATSTWFMPFISSAPGFADKYANTGQESILDAEMLSAVQAAWPKVADLYSSVLVPVTAP
jgi:hypothetical protein